MNQILEILFTFLRLGALSFGGGMANLPEMAKLLIDHGWVSRQQFADGFALGQFVPGPNMLAVLFYGVHAAGIGGGLAAALGMFLPGAVGAALLVWGWEWMARAQWSRALRKTLVPVGMGLSASMIVVLVQLSIESLLWLAVMVLATVLIYRGMSVFPVIVGGAILGLLVALL